MGGLLVVAALTAYIPALRGGYLWDDDAHVQYNYALRDLEGLWRIWIAVVDSRTVHPINVQYYPLTYTSLWLDYHLWGLDTLGYHVVNVVLHGLSAILLWRLLSWLGVPGAWLAAAVFALHPVHVESVAWITERKNTLSGVFYLASAMAYVRFCPADFGLASESDVAGGTRRWGNYALALLLYICALLSKTVTCSLPAAILLVIWWKRGRLLWRDVWPVAPFLAIGLVLGLVSAWMERSSGGATGAAWSLSGLERCLLAGRIVWFYAGKLLWPHPLMFNYPRWEVDASRLWQYAFPLAVLVVLTGLFLARRRIGRGPLVGVLFFVGTLTPALGFFNVYPMIYSYVADHFQYHASIGLIVLIVATGVWAVRRFLPKHEVLARILAGAWLVLLGALTWNQAHAYQSDEALYRDTLAKNPGSWMAHGNLAVVLARSGRMDEALQHCREAVRLKPDSWLTHNTLGGVLLSAGRVDEAIREFEASLRIMPDYEHAHNKLGTSLLQKGETDRAIVHFRRAVERRPDHPKFLHNLGLAMHVKGQSDEAANLLRKALKLLPDYARAHGNLGTVLLTLDRNEEAAYHLRRAIELQPDNVEARFNLAAALRRLGRDEEAAQQYVEILRVAPDHIRARCVLAELYRRQGRLDDAISEYREAVHRIPEDPQVCNGLAWALATHPYPSEQDKAEAVRLAERACQATGHSLPQILDTLAAAYAQAGRFQEAAKTANRAVELAEQTGKKPLADELRQRLKLYQAGRPFRESGG